jgi:hypothetical protein
MPVLEEYDNDETYRDIIEDRLFTAILCTGTIVIVLSISAVVTFFILSLVKGT